jgi:hypothetical protein
MADDDVTALRLALQAGGYAPIPLWGKRPRIAEWQKRDASHDEIVSWRKWRGTGILAGPTPGLDDDIRDPDAATAVEELIRDWFEGRGEILVRFGEAPKRLFPFRTSTPFPKIRVEFKAPNGTDHAIEMLGEGQQFVVFGIHPDTKRPYSWHADRTPWTVPRCDLPEIDEAEAHALVQKITEMLQKQFGFVVVQGAIPKTNGHAGASAGFTIIQDADGKLDVDACLIAMEPSGAGVNDMQPRCLLALLQRGWHPDEAIKKVVAGTMIMAESNNLGWDHQVEIQAVTRRCVSGVRKLGSEYDASTGTIPTWLASEFHDAWADVLLAGQRPQLCHVGGVWQVVADGTADNPGGINGAEPERPAKSAFDLAVPLTIEEWLSRDLPPPDRLMGEWITTTSRILISADTGLGKTNLGMALGAHSAAAISFLHWQAHRPARVLYIDGEMSRRLFKQRIADATRRLGLSPSGLFLFSREDVENFQPLNTPVGTAFLNKLLDQIGGIDLVIFDNIMALLTGDQKDEDSWTRILPTVTSLTKRNIGQIWINHTGHDPSRSYGTKTREWRMDVVVHLVEEKRGDTDVSFRLEFRKARDRTPETRADFEDVTIALVNDQWVGSATVKQVRPKAGSIDAKFLEVLEGVIASQNVISVSGRRMVQSEVWRDACVRCGLLNPTKLGREGSSRTAFYRYRSHLIAANLIVCEGDLVGLLP